MDIRSFIPVDRRLALARGAQLPERARGVALLADLSGFTALTEAYTLALGPQRGAEEISYLLNRIYAALIDRIELYGGCVIGFSGDAITCWFDDARLEFSLLSVELADIQNSTLSTRNSAAHRAATAALALQVAMRELPTLPLAAPAPLALKCALAAGSARRFLVGDPRLQLLDMLAGPPITRVGALEHEARPGEVLLEPSLARALAAAGPYGTWRPRAATGERSFALGGLAAPAEPRPWPALPPGALADEQVRPWLLPAVWQRLRQGGGEFLPELRPAIALFVRFTGIDYTRPAMRDWLDAYIGWAQGLLARYEGALLQLTVGDKGSYFYAAFGAPVAHADDAARALAAARLLVSPPADFQFIQATHIGLGAGLVYAGTYGSPGRLTYGALGDPVNLAARLMEVAQPGQILATQPVAQAGGARFEWGELASVTLKGKSQQVPVWQLAGEHVESRLGALELSQRGPLLGRARALERVAELVQLAARGRGQLLALQGDAGMGKSRLVAAAVALAESAGLQIYGGAAQSYGTQTPYLAWRQIGQAMFDLPADAPPAERAAALGRRLAEADPALLPRLPLLGPVLGLALPDTPLTAEMDAALRKASLEALLIDYLRARARRQPLALVFEDCHWLDPLSADLLLAAARALAGFPALLLLAYRPHDQAQNPLAPLEQLAHATTLSLPPLADPDARTLVLARLGLRALGLPERLLAQIVARGEGNPFFLEELVAYLADRQLDWRDTAAVERLELPTSLHRLLLARIDQLTEPGRLVLKVASIIGRRFRQPQLWGVYPTLGPPSLVIGELSALDRQGLVIPEHDELGQAYLFKHQAIYEVAYASLPQTLRARLHEQFAAWLEAGSAAAGALPPLDLLAYHYGQSANQGKQREYFRRAGDAAAATYANAAAAQYYERLLELLAPAEQPAVLIELGWVLVRAGQWDLALARYAAVHAAAGASPRERAAALWGLGHVRRLQGDWREAEMWLQQARASYDQLGQSDGLVRALADLAIVYRMQGRYEPSYAAALESEALARAAGDSRGVASARIQLGRLAFEQGAYPSAQANFAQALALFRSIGDHPEIAHILLAQAQVLDAQGEHLQAHALVEECLAIARRLGDRTGIVFALGSLGLIALNQGDLATARALTEESMTLFRDLGDRRGILVAYNNLGLIAAHSASWQAAREHYCEALARATELGARYQSVLALVGLAASTIGGARPQDSLAHAVGWLALVSRELASLGVVLERLERAMLDQALATARAALGEPAFGAAWAAGAQLDWDGVCEHALPRALAALESSG